MLKETTDQLLARIRKGHEVSLSQQLQLTWRLSVPAMLAQLSYIVMTYIDAAMVGHLGDDAAASIGLVSTSTWLFGGIGSGFTAGFYVQVAHLIGANNISGARSVLRQSLPTIVLLGLLVGGIGAAISFGLPKWLGGTPEVCPDSTRYFFIFSLAIPLAMLNQLASGMLRCSGNIKLPSMLNVMMCVLDVLFNALFIFPSRTVEIFGITMYVPCANMGVTGAALATALAEFVTLFFMMGYLIFCSAELHLWHTTGSFMPQRDCLIKAAKIGLPMTCERVVMNGAQVASTTIVAPLGMASIAANSFAITAESLCYMPGFGISEATTTLVGQCVGAKRRDLTWSFAKLTTWLGIGVMSLMGILLYIFAPQMIAFMTPSTEIQHLGTSVLRIEAFAEPMFAASIVAYYSFVGAGNTLAPALMNLGSIWLVRIPLAILFAPIWGLQGVWLAMCLELCFRGVIFLTRLYRKRWITKAL